MPYKDKRKLYEYIKKRQKKYQIGKLLTQVKHDLLDLGIDLDKIEWVKQNG